MKIVFIRHGKPDYESDSLLHIGKLQAEAVAQRVKSCGISELYASTMGRALQTAEPIARELGLDVKQCDFMREVTWGNDGGSKLRLDGNPWFLVADMIKNGEALTSEKWKEEQPFSENTKLLASVERVIKGADGWLASFGLERAGDYYRINAEYQDKTVAMVSHGGSSSVLLSHMLNIPFPLVCSFFRPYFTSITVVEISGSVGEFARVKLITLGERYHVPTDDDIGEIKQ